MRHEEVERRLPSLPGIGVWTAAEVRQRAHGDADAVSFGDYHVAKDVGWALTGTTFDDAELAEFLEPWRPHRNRVATLLALAGPRRPRHGPRMAPRTHLPVLQIVLWIRAGRSSHYDNRQGGLHEVPDVRLPRPAPARRHRRLGTLEVEDWVEKYDDAGVRLMGERVRPAEDATSVTRREAR